MLDICKHRNLLQLWACLKWSLLGRNRNLRQVESETQDCAVGKIYCAKRFLMLDTVSAAIHSLH